MTVRPRSLDLLDDLDRIARVRAQLADALARIATILQRAETDADSGSGRLELDVDIDDLDRVGTSLKQGVFRLLVLGDMKRGKSTFLNALIGENLLPSDVNPCTALLTVLRYGPDKRVTIHFNDDTPSDRIDFATFKHRYTIDPAEAKRLEASREDAFPNISHAVVEYPLPLLEKGVEIVDSPGLNDTEARNELSLGYINNCHAILFVLRATQPCTLAERRYLENYIKGRGLSVFFLVNAWDQVKESLIDPDDSEELAAAEAKLDRVFRANLAEYCHVDGHDLYSDRVFRLSSLTALRRRVKDPNADLSGTGFPDFLHALNVFLTQERAIAEFRQGRTLARQTDRRVREAVERRIPLLENSVRELRDRVRSVEPEFTQLREIRTQFGSDIRNLRDRKAEGISRSFSDYVMGLGDSFETDFLRYQPDLNFLSALSAGKRQQFERELRLAFERYINDKLTAWARGAEEEMDAAFAHLSQKAESYGASYTRVTDSINEKLTGQKVPPRSESAADSSPAWAKWAAGIFSLARGNIAGVALAGAGFDWQNILLNFLTVAGIGSLVSAITGIALGPIGLALVRLGVGLFQADQGRKELVKVAKKELVGHLPQIAQTYTPTVRAAICDCFDAYEREVVERIDRDIQARKSELDNLIAQMESRTIDKDKELERLRCLEREVGEQVAIIDAAYQQFLAAAS